MSYVEETKGPASLGQRLLWVFERRRAVKGALTSAIVIRKRGTWNGDAFCAAVDALIERHETLRTRLHWDGSRLNRVVSVDWRPAVAYADASTGDNPIAECERILKREYTTDLASSEWPVRVKVIRLADEDHIVFVGVHHMATDQNSNQRIVAELAHFYRAACGETVERLPLIDWQYTDWVASQVREYETQSEARHSDYWTRQLDGAVGPTLPAPNTTDPSRRLTGFDILSLSDALVPNLTSVAERERATLLSVSLAAFFATVFCATNQTDLTVTSILSDRNRPEIAHTVGFFARSVALRTRFVASDTFASLVGKCRATILDAMQNQLMPFHAIKPVEDLGARTNLIDVVFQILEPPSSVAPFEIWPRTPDLDTGRTFDLEILLMRIEGRWHVSALYGVHRLTAEFVRTMLHNFVNTATRVVRNPELPLESLKEEMSMDIAARQSPDSATAAGLSAV